MTLNVVEQKDLNSVIEHLEFCIFKADSVEDHFLKIQWYFEGNSYLECLKRLGLICDKYYDLYRGQLGSVCEKF